MRKIASIILIFTLVLAMPLSSFAATATAIKFEKTSDMKAEVGKSYKREAITTPEGATVVYSSSNTKIATVDSNGRVTAIAEGIATITAKSGNVKASYNIVISKTDGNTAGSSNTSSKSGASINDKGYIVFPDVNLKKYLLEICKSIVINQVTISNVEVARKVVAQGGEITPTQAAAMPRLYFSPSLYPNIGKLKDLSGIEYFTSLKELDVGNHELTAIHLSANKNLEYLSCNDNKLTKLDISKNAKLKTLNADNNPLTSLDVTNNPALESLYIAVSSSQNSSIKSINLTKNTALNTLRMSGYKNLTSLDLSKNTKLTVLQIHSNNLTSLDVSQNTALEHLACGDNKIEKLDISKNRNLRLLDCWSNQLSTLNIKNNSKLEFLDIRFNNLKSESDIVGLNKSQLRTFRM